MRIALVSRELYPLGGGGIGQFVNAAASLLAQIAEVTVITTSLFEEHYRRLRAERDRRLPGEEVRVEFVSEPTLEEAGGWYHVMHCYGARVYERLAQLYPEGGPELVEFPDFLGEAFVTLQAAQTLDPFLAQTRVCVRLHTTAEICEVLNGFYRRDDASEALHAIERFSLAQADRLIWQGGDILGAYRRFYGDALAPATMIRYPYRGPTAAGGQGEPQLGAEPLRILYAGRLERRKGIRNLVRALTGLDRQDVRLTIVGADTDTAPLGESMAAMLALEIAEDPRFELRGPIAREELGALITGHHLVAVPSLWECWPYAALEALALNRPVLGTSVGGLVEMVRPGQSGWLARSSEPPDLEEALERALGERPLLGELIAAQRPLETARALTDDRQILDSYRRLLSEPAPRGGRRCGCRGGAGPAAGPAARSDDRPHAAPTGGRPPLVSAIVPYHRAWRYVRETIDSLLAQSYPRLEIVLVNDGSFEDQDWIVAELVGRLPVQVVSQVNAGLGAARNLGVHQSRGRYVLPLDADNAIAPEFLARAVEVLERRPEIVYVTSWSLYIDEHGVPLARPDVGYEPLGNHAQTLLERDNVAGDAAALIRRSVFDGGFRYSEELTSYEDWHFFRELARAGRLGAVIPKRLLRYRVREDSMQAVIAQPRRERLEGEIEALIRENAVRWTSSSA